MNINYDYHISTCFISDMPNYSKAHSQDYLEKTLDAKLQALIEDNLASPNEDYLEVNSHSIAFIGDTVMLSVIFQRRRS